MRRGSPVAMTKNGLRAVIWDMDGVIVDSAPYHLSAWQDTFRKRGVNFTEDDFKRYFGQRNDTIIRATLKDSLSPEEVDAIASEKEEDYRQKMGQNITPLAGAIALIKLLHDRGVKMAIASSAPLENIQLILQRLGIDSFFQAIVWGREVSEGKPSPQGFLLAARKLGVKPQDCVAIEDAVAGVAAAKGAGMKCVAVTTTHNRANLKEADLIVDSLEVVDMGVLNGLFK